MSRKLAALLGKPQTPISLTIEKLEHLSGYESTDVRLLAEINNKLRQATAELGLDVDDTTPEELYHALSARFTDDEQKLRKALGITDDSSDFAQKVIELVKKSDKLPQVYALKRNVAKALLRKQPPKKLMKSLNYRSLDSLLKRENVAAIYSSLPTTESERWHKAFSRQLSHLTSADFEDRDIEFVPVPTKYRKSNIGLEPIRIVPEVGSITITESAYKLGVFGISLLIAHNATILKLHSIHVKTLTMENSFGKNFTNLLQNGRDEPAKLIHMPISWKTIFASFSKNLEDEYSELFGPHVVAEDLKVPSSIEILSSASSVFKWWSNLEHVALHIGNRPISLNAMDVLINVTNSKEFNKRSTQHFQHHLWHEFISRYFDFPSVKAFVTAQIMDGHTPLRSFEVEPNFGAELYDGTTLERQVKREYA